MYFFFISFDKIFLSTDFNLERFSLGRSHRRIIQRHGHLILISIIRGKHKVIALLGLCFVITSIKLLVRALDTFDYCCWWLFVFSLEDKVLLTSQGALVKVLPESCSSTRAAQMAWEWVGYHSGLSHNQAMVGGNCVLQMWLDAHTSDTAQVSLHIPWLSWVSVGLITAKSAAAGIHCGPLVVVLQLIVDGVPQGRFVLFLLIKT